MRLRRCAYSLLFLLCSALLFQAVPAQAAHILIDPRQPIGIMSDKTAVQKIAALQNYTNYRALTAISPDDKYMLVATSKGLNTKFSFLNVQDGSFQPLDVRGLLKTLPLTALVWTDSNTLVYLGLTINYRPALVQLDRLSGKTTVTTLQLPGFPLSISPDASKLLITLPANTKNVLEALDPLQSPFDVQIKRNFSDTVVDDTQTEDFLGHLFPAERTRVEGIKFAGSDPFAFSTKSLSLAVWDLRSGKVLPLFVSPGGVAISSIGWAADSSKLALTRTTIANVTTQGNLLSDLATQDGLGRLTPAKNPFLQGNVVDTVNFSTDEIKAGFLKAGDGNGDSFERAGWSTDGKTLVAQMAEPSKLAGRANPVYLVPQHTYLRFYNPAGQLLNTFDTPEIDAPGASSATFISPDEVLINAVTGTNVRVYYYNRATGEFRVLPMADGYMLGLNVTHASRQVVFEFSSFTQAPELFRLNLDGTALYELSFLNLDLTKAGAVRADKVSFTLADGQVRAGFILQKAGAAFPPKNVPLVVWQEGGPTAPYINRWAANVENPFDLLPNFGYAVLFVPLEGRIGFGPKRLNALADAANFGQIDIDEQAQIVQQTIDRGYTAKGSVGITGCSYGGYFTSQSIARHPDVYSVAVTQCTLLDLVREFQFGQTAYISYLMGRTPLDDSPEYLNDSPLYNVNNIKAATLIFGGVYDFLPVQVSINFHDQLQANGLATNVMVYKSEGHGLILPTNQLIAAQAQINWFDQFLTKPQS
jgi:dipeptidyl aminopeptidase/acylaminoacyl peptidase